MKTCLTLGKQASWMPLCTYFINQLIAFRESPDMCLKKALVGVKKCENRFLAKKIGQTLVKQKELKV